MAAQGHSFCERSQRSLAKVYIIKERIGWITGKVVVVTRQGQRVGMSRRHTSRYLHPRCFIVAGLGQNGASCSRGIVLECGRCPVIGYRIGAMHLVPEAQRCKTTGNREGLTNSAIAIGGRSRTGLTGVATTVRCIADRGRGTRCPAGEGSCLKATVNDATAACPRYRHRNGCAMRDTTFRTCHSNSIVRWGHR